MEREAKFIGTNEKLTAFDYYLLKIKESSGYIILEIYNIKTNDFILSLNYSNFTEFLKNWDDIMTPFISEDNEESESVYLRKNPEI